MMNIIAANCIGS